MASYDYRVDWDNDGDFTDPGDDVTARTLARDQVSIRTGRDQARSLAPTSVGEESKLVSNLSRDYSPENSSSPLAGKLVPGRPVRDQATHDGLTYGLFRGRLDGFELHPEIQERTVSLSALDALAELAETEIHTELFEGISTGQAIDAVLDAAGWDTDLRALDMGGTFIAWWWADGITAGEAISQLVASEGSPSYIHADGDGRIVFRDRHHRMVGSESQTVQATFRDAGAEPLFSAPLGYDIGFRDVINQVTLTYESRELASFETLYTNPRQVVIPEHAFVNIDLTFEDPIHNIAVDIDDTSSFGSYTEFSWSLSRDSGQSTTLTLFMADSFADSTLTLLPGAITVTGFPLRSTGTATRTARDTESQRQYGVRSLSIDAPWAGIRHGQAIANLVIGQRSERLPTIALRLVSGIRGNSTRMEHMLARGLSDRVRVVEPETGLDHDFSIETISHEIGSAGHAHETTFGCEKIREQTTSMFEFDHATNGRFDTGKFAYSGVQPLPGATLLNPNPYFEADASDWSALGGASVARSSAYAHEGRWSLEVTPDGVTGNPGSDSPAAGIAVTPGVYYTISGWLYSPTGYGGGGGIRINWADSGNILISTNTRVDLLPAGQWVYRILTAVAPPTAAFGRFRLLQTGIAPSSAVFYADELKFTTPYETMILGGSLLGTGRLAL